MNFLLLLYIVILFAANVLGSLAGFGAGMVSLPLLMLFLDAKAVVAASTMMCVINVIIAVQHRREILWREFLRILLGMCLGLPFGVWALAFLPVAVLKGALGLLMLTVGAHGLWHHKQPAKKNRPLGRVAGFFCLFFGGLLQGAISSGGSLLVVYAQSRNMGKQQFRATLSLIWAVTAVLTTVQYVWAKTLTPQAFALFMWGWPAVLCGIIVGGRLSRRIGQRGFSVVVNSVIFVAGLLSLFTVLTSL